MNNERVNSLDEMRQGREESSTAFMEFANRRTNYQNYVFCFYEGEDGKYYDNRIRNIIGNNFIHIKAGNKKKVLKTMKLIKSKSEYKDVTTMFFVDRDMEFNMAEYEEKDVFVTPCYSIENLYVNEVSVGMILETEFSLNIYDEDYIKYKNRFIELHEKFCDLILEFNALVLLRKEKNLDSERVKIQSIKTTDLIDIDIINGLSKNEKYNRIINSLKEQLGVTDDDIKLAQIKLVEYGEKSATFRGKNQFDFMSKYIEQLCNKKNILFNPVPTSVNINPNQNRLSIFSSYACTPECLKLFLEAHKLKEKALC